MAGAYRGSALLGILTVAVVAAAVSACESGTVIPGPSSGTGDGFPETYTVADHTVVGMLADGRIPRSAIEAAKSRLNVAYGHTSHGSQITDGMRGLVAFANGRGLGGVYPGDLFAFDAGGTGNALGLREDMSGDCGYYPRWVDETEEMLRRHPEVNVIIWSWCGQVDDKYADGTLESEYLSPMARLEAAYPDVAFVYMTGHLDHGDHANNVAANDAVRRFCRENGKILYDFADIESYDPSGRYFPYANDSCDYFSSASDRTADGNWAEEWAASHVENTDWYSCPSAHSRAVNANMKAYAAWWLWCRLAGWDGSAGS